MLLLFVAVLEAQVAQVSPWAGPEVVRPWGSGACAPRRFRAAACTPTMRRGRVCAPRASPSCCPCRHQTVTATRGLFCTAAVSSEGGTTSHPQCPGVCDLPARAPATHYVVLSRDHVRQEMRPHGEILESFLRQQ